MEAKIAVLGHVSPLPLFCGSGFLPQKKKKKTPASTYGEIAGEDIFFYFVNSTS